MTDNDSLIAAAIENNLSSANEYDVNGEIANVVDGLFAIARGLHHVAKAVERLGLNDANTGMGAVEVLSLEIKQGSERIASALLLHEG